MAICRISFGMLKFSWTVCVLNCSFSFMYRRRNARPLQRRQSIGCTWPLEEERALRQGPIDGRLIA
jgi:hypothetical protein